MKNPNDPIWRKDSAVALYRTIMKRHHPRGKPSDVYNWYGMTVAWTMVETLKRSGKTPTRAGLLRAAQNLNLAGNPFLLPGIALKTTRTRYFPLDRVYLYRYDNRQWVKVEFASGRTRVVWLRTATHKTWGKKPMSKTIRMLLLGLVGAFALSSTGTALAAYTSPSLRVTDDRSSVTIRYTVSGSDDPTAKLTFYAPTGYTASLTAPAGTTLGTVTAQGTAADLGGALLPLTGTVQARAANGTFTSAPGGQPTPLAAAADAVHRHPDAHRVLGLDPAGGRTDARAARLRRFARSRRQAPRRARSRPRRSRPACRRRTCRRVRPAARASASS